MAGLRERHKLRIRDALRDAALARFIQYGFDATTVEDIAADVDVSPRTFFRYFSTKDAVVVTPWVAVFDRWEQCIRSAPAGQPLIQAMKDASHLVTDAYEHNAEFWDRHHHAVTADPTLALKMLETQATVLQRAAAVIGDRLGLDAQKDLRPRILAAAAMAGVGAAVAHWYASGQRADRRALVDAAHDEIAPASELLQRSLLAGPRTDRPLAEVARREVESHAE